MKNLCIASAVVAFSCTAALRAEGTNDWENLAVNPINRLPARTYSMPSRTERYRLS